MSFAARPGAQPGAAPAWLDKLDNIAATQDNTRGIWFFICFYFYLFYSADTTGLHIVIKKKKQKVTGCFHFRPGCLFRFLLAQPTFHP